MIKNIFSAIILIFIGCSCNETNYSDLKYLGFSDNVKKITIKMYNNPVEKFGEWKVDGEAFVTQIYSFNKNGMINEFVQFIPTFSSTTTTTYTFSNSIKKQGTTISNGALVTLTNYSYTDSIVTEKIYNPEGKISNEKIIFLSEGKIPIKEIENYYENSSNIISNFTTKQIISRFGLYPIAFSINYSSPIGAKELYEEIILTKDKKGNPLSVLSKRDEKPIHYKEFEILY